MKKLKVVAKKIRATHIDELRKEREKEFAFVDDENTAPLDKLRALRDLQAELYKKEGYTGVLPELYITDEPNSFAVDGKNGETRKIFISLNDLKRGNSSALLYAHENAHLIQTDKGEEIAKYAETKIGENKNKFTESEKEEYLSNLRKNVSIDKTLEEQFEIARSIPESERENKVYLMERDLDTILLINSKEWNYTKGAGHTSIPIIPDKQDNFFTEDGKIKEELKLKYKNLPEAKKFENGKYGWIIGGFKGEEEKGENKGKLVARFNDSTDVEVFNKINNWKNETPLTGKIISEINHPKKDDTELIMSILKEAIEYKNNSNHEKYSLIPINFIAPSSEEYLEDFSIHFGYNCNSFSNTILRNVGVTLPFKDSTFFRIKTGKNSYFKQKEGER